VPTQTETPAPTLTPTITLTPSETPLAYAPGNVFAISLGTPQSFALKGHAAPLRYDDFVQDDFDSTTLDSAWTWDEPLSGPSWSLTDNPDSFQFTVPGGYEHWENVNNAPSLQRTDMEIVTLPLKPISNLKQIAPAAAINLA
jgi:hypothetical protein